MTEKKREFRDAWLVVLFVCLSALYLTLPTARHSYDAVAYALDVEHAVVNASFERLWHDYHILYNPLGYVLHTIGRRAGLHPLMTMQMWNSITAALLATFLAGFLQRRTGSRLLGCCGGLGFAVSGSFWYYSSNAEPYVISLLGLLCLLAWLPLDRESPHHGRRVFLSAIAFGLAVGFHLSAIVLAPIIVFFLLQAGPRVPGRRFPGLRGVTWFAAVSGVLIAAPYAHKWLNVSRGGALRGFEQMWGDFFAPTNPVTDLHFLARPFSPATEYLALLRGFSPSTSESSSASFQAALYVVPGVLTGTALVGAWRALRDGRRKELLPIACFLTMLLFFSTYNLGDMKFTVFLAFFLVIAAILSAGEMATAYPRIRRWLWVLPVLVILLGAGNYVNFIRPWSRDDTNPDLLDSLLIRERTGPRDGVILVGRGERNNLKVYVPYFGEREVIILDFLFNPSILPRENSFSRVRRRIEAIEARGGALWAIADVVEKGPDTRSFLLRNALTTDALDTNLLVGFDTGPPIGRDGIPLIYPLQRVKGGTDRPSG
jgi:hypothetical protein